jgi:hypothetical protein
MNIMETIRIVPVISYIPEAFDRQGRSQRRVFPPGKYESRFAGAFFEIRNPIKTVNINIANDYDNVDERKCHAGLISKVCC